MTESRAKAEITRRSNAEKRAAREAAHRAALEQDRPLVLNALRAVLTALDATTAEKIFALCVLDSMMGYNFIPYSVKHPGTGNDEVIADFVKRLKEYEAANSK